MHFNLKGKKNVLIFVVLVVDVVKTCLHKTKTMIEYLDRNPS